MTIAKTSKTVRIETSPRRALVIVTGVGERLEVMHAQVNPANFGRDAVLTVSYKLHGTNADQMSVAIEHVGMGAIPKSEPTPDTLRSGERPKYDRFILFNDKGEVLHGLHTLCPRPREEWQLAVTLECYRAVCDHPSNWRISGDPEIEPSSWLEEIDGDRRALIRGDDNLVGDLETKTKGLRADTVIHDELTNYPPPKSQPWCVRSEGE